LSPMRIAYVSTIRSAAWGGSEELWFQSAKAALDRQHTVGVFVYEWADEPAALKDLRNRGALIVKRPRSASLGKRILHRLSARLGNSLDSALNPYKAIKEFNPDCVVVTDGSTYYAADDAWLRSLLMDDFAGKYIIISQGNGPYNFPGDRAAAIRFFEAAKKIIFVAETNRQQAFHQLAHKIDNSAIVQNPVNLAAYDLLPPPESKDDCIHFAMVGRMFVGDKGQDIVIALMAEDFWRNADVRIHIYGKGSDLAYIRELIAFYKVEEKVIIEGHTTIENIWARCHALLMPSIIEGTPLTLLEAMVLGRICIVTKVGGNEEWIRDGENGFLAPAPTQELLSQKMKEAYLQRDKWPAMAATAHAEAIAKLDMHPGNTLLQHITA